MYSIAFALIRILRRILQKYFTPRGSVRFSRSTMALHGSDTDVQAPDTKPNKPKLSPVQVLKHELCLAYLARVNKKRLNLRESIELLNFAKDFWRKVSRRHPNKEVLLDALVVDIRNPEKIEAAKRKSRMGFTEAEINGNRTMKRIAVCLTDYYIAHPTEGEFFENSEDDTDEEEEKPKPKSKKRRQRKPRAARK